METKVISIEWPPNVWKTKLISNQELLYDKKKLLVYPEVARTVMKDFPWSEADQNIFQDIIFYRESERLYQLDRDVKKWLWDLILVDRTSLSWRIFSRFNEDNWNSNKTTPAIINPKIYDRVILFTKPIGDYGWWVKAFNDYNNPQLNELFDQYITRCFPQTVKFDNYLRNQWEADNEIASVLWLGNCMDQEKELLITEITELMQEAEVARYEDKYSSLSILRQEISNWYDLASAKASLKSIQEKWPYII